MRPLLFLHSHVAIVIFLRRLAGCPSFRGVLFRIRRWHARAATYYRWLRYYHYTGAIILEQYLSDEHERGERSAKRGW